MRLNEHIFFFEIAYKYTKMVIQNYVGYNYESPIHETSYETTSALILSCRARNPIKKCQWKKNLT